MKNGNAWKAIAAGIAIAGVITPYFINALALIFLRISQFGQSLGLFTMSGVPHKTYIRELVKKGVPIFIQRAAEIARRDSRKG